QRIRTAPAIQPLSAIRHVPPAAPAAFGSGRAAMVGGTGRPPHTTPSDAPEHAGLNPALRRPTRALRGDARGARTGLLAAFGGCSATSGRWGGADSKPWLPPAAAAGV